MSRKPAKYDHSRYFWHEHDLFQDCNKEVMKCLEGYKGHFTTHLNQNVQEYRNGELFLQVIKYIAHSHFTHETDRSRHTICEIGRTFINSKYCHHQYALHFKDLPDWVKDDLYRNGN